MAGQLLSAEDRTPFLTLLRRQMNSAVHRRTNVLLLRDDGWTPHQSAIALYLDESTVGEHRRLYLDQGRTGVESPALGWAGLSPVGGPTSGVGCVGDERGAAHGKAVCAQVEAVFGVSYAVHAMARLLGQRRLGGLDPGGGDPGGVGDGHAIRPACLFLHSHACVGSRMEYCQSDAANRTPRRPIDVRYLTVAD